MLITGKSLFINKKANRIIMATKNRHCFPFTGFDQWRFGQ